MTTFQGNGWVAKVDFIFASLSFRGEVVTFTPSEVGMDAGDLRGFLVRHLNSSTSEIINLLNARV